MPEVPKVPKVDEVARERSTLGTLDTSNFRHLHIGVGEWWALASAATYALANVMIRVVSVVGDALAGALIRVIPVAAIAVGVMVWRHRATLRRLLPGRGDFFGWPMIGGLAVYTLVISPVANLAIYLAFRYGGVLVAVPVMSLHPLWGALLAVPFLGEAFNRRIGGGIVAAVLGIALLTYGQHVGVPVSPEWPLGLLYAMITGLCFALGANLNRYLLPRGVDVFTLLAITNLGGILILGLVLAGQGRLDALTSFSSGELAKLTFAGALSGLGSLTLFTAFAFASVASVTTLKSLDTALASVIAILALGETLNLPIAVGLILILAGAFAVQMGKRPVPAAG